MKSKIDGIVIICMFAILYINLTDFPKPLKRVVSGPLIKIEITE